MINITGLAWLLLQALQLNAEAWDRLLAPLGGQMPADEFQLNELMERIRRLYHVRDLLGEVHHGLIQTLDRLHHREAPSTALPWPWP